MSYPLRSRVGEMVRRLMVYGLSLGHVPSVGWELWDGTVWTGAEHPSPEPAISYASHTLSFSNVMMVGMHAKSIQTHFNSLYRCCVWTSSQACVPSMFAVIARIAAEAVCLEESLHQSGLGGGQLGRQCPALLCFEDTRPVVSHRVCN